ncbi:hypothetical protein KFL_003960030 [Klebsormidium nitens]|uniref:c-Myc-binding protein n=1 Tax=Klebsormidium nitens TaxID=105231 RepID=A0A1Y1IDK9_KLENI|nr:hypothetical protein KFL_003960030 [Klebsormidium nitens]|eukprot:GAQ88042.1 hypothetical protein KFL_003960030 [Klebsormidium nitens]
MATESKKEAFRKYLESSGVLDSLTKVLVSLYEEPEKPPTGIDFVKAHLGGPTPQEFEQLRKEKEELQAKYDELQTRCEELSRKVEALETGESTTTT